MTGQAIEAPEPGATPFFSLEEASVWTLAGRLVGLTLQLCGGPEYLEDAPKDVAQLELPSINAGSLKALAGFLQESSYYLDYVGLTPEGDRLLNLPADGKKLQTLYSSCSKDASVAMPLIMACLRHPHIVVRTAAAASLRPLMESDETRFHFPAPEAHRVEMILKQALWDEDLGVRELALAGSDTAPPAPIAGGSGEHQSQRQRGPRSLIVPGTRGYQGNWWRPHGAFHDYLSNGPKLNLTKNESPWSWSGENSSKARQIAARDLAHWQRDQKIRKFDTLIGHSYGGGIALMATQYGAKARKIILLSTPVHDYETDWGNVEKVVSLRINCDLVLMLDSLYYIVRFRRTPIRQRFSDPRIEELAALPFWFRAHSSTHDPNVWVEHSVSELVLA